MPLRLFHLVLGLGLFVMSLETLLHAIHQGHSHLHLALVAGIQAAGAALFLVPKTRKVGGALLLLTLVGALVLHALQREWRLDLLIYAAGVWLVMSGRR
jgi:hypothetical protein